MVRSVNIDKMRDYGYEEGRIQERRNKQDR